MYINIIDNIAGRYFNAMRNVKLLEIIKQLLLINHSTSLSIV